MTERLPPQEQPESHPHASTWIEEQIAHAGGALIAPPEQVRTWGLSRVLRMQTSIGTMYFKASMRQPLFADEAAVLAFLASVCRHRVPRVIATEPEFRWMLLDDAGDPLPGPVTVERKTELLMTFSEIQCATIGFVDRLLDLGCADRRPQTLLAQIDPLLQDELALSTLALTEIGELRGRAAEIIGICLRLSGFAIPPTLIHGDLHAGNILVRNGGPVFIDWAEACIAHPFMDAFMIYNVEDATVRNRMRDAYLATWADHETVERLRELWSLCGVAHAMHHAVSYWTILRHLNEDMRGELAGTLPFLLRKALRYLNHPA